MTQFVVGSPAREQHFYGRARELQILGRQTWTWLCGQRRMGKSSVLFRLERDLQAAGRLPLFYSPGGLPEAADGRALFRHFFARHAREQLEPRRIRAEDFAGQEAAVAFAHLIARLRDAGVPEVIFLWDEAEFLLALARHDPDFFRALSTVPIPEGFRCVLAASQSLAGLFAPEGNRDPSFLTRFRWLPIAGLDEPDARDLLRCEQTGGWTEPPSARVLSAAVEWTGGHPFILQQLGQALAHQSEGDGRRITADVFRCCCGILASDSSLRDIFQDDFGRLTPAQQGILKTLCQTPANLTLADLAKAAGLPEAEVADALGFLLNYGYIFWGDQVRLRFGFYRDLLPADTSTTQVEAARVRRIARDLYLSDHEARLVARFKADGPKRILALDGGGIRGALTLGFLERLEQILRQRHEWAELRLCDYFDLIGGTSTGAIIATALAMGKEVKEVKELYLELGGRVFGKKRSWWGRLVALFQETELRNVLRRHFDNAVFGDERIRTGLCIFIKRADLNQTFPLYNHPHGRFYARRRGILVRDAVRASTAAPTYFVPEELEIGRGEVGAFVDGGLSMVNNPALYLFLLATLKRFPFHWPRTDQKLLLVSVGTGAWYQRVEIRRVVRSKLWDWAAQVPSILMDDASVYNQLVLQCLSESPTPVEIDDEFGHLEDDLLLSALHYLRYNVLLDKTTLAALGLAHLTPKVEALREMSAGENRDLLVEIGKAAAERYMHPDHFPGVFDLPRPHPWPSNRPAAGGGEGDEPCGASEAV
jgi:uncharacterized protein